MKPSLEHLSKRISDLLPSNIKNLQDDFESNIHQLLQSAFSKMNLVTREEFDIQSALLQRSREKLEQLEKVLQQLEQNQPPASKK